MSDERRNSERKTVNLVVKWDSLSGSYEAKLEDISLSGCFVNTTGMTDLNEAVNLEVLLPSGNWLSLKGTVTTSQPGIGFGVAFSSLTAEQTQAVEELCRDAY
jgi:PilZ domain-containing protein